MLPNSVADSPMLLKECLGRRPFTNPVPLPGSIEILPGPLIDEVPLPIDALPEHLLDEQQSLETKVVNRIEHAQQRPLSGRRIAMRDGGLVPGLPQDVRVAQVHHSSGITRVVGLDRQRVDQRPILRPIGLLHAGDDVTAGDTGDGISSPRFAHARRPTEEIEVPFRRFGLLERRHVARPSAGEVLRLERCAEEAPIGNPPVRAADPMLQFAEQRDETVHIGGCDDPIGVLRVLLEPILDACHPGREHARDPAAAQQSLERPIEIDGIAHTVIFEPHAVIPQALPGATNGSDNTASGIGFCPMRWQFARRCVKIPLRRTDCWSSSQPPFGPRMGGRAVECTGLENRQRRKSLVGSNPTPSVWPFRPQEPPLGTETHKPLLGTGVGRVVRFHAFGEDATSVATRPVNMAASCESCPGIIRQVNGRRAICLRPPYTHAFVKDGSQTPLAAGHWLRVR